MLHGEMIYLLTATGLTAGGSSTVYIYTQTVHRTTIKTEYQERNMHYIKHTHNNKNK
jgi:hypothetical protein